MARKATLPAGELNWQQARFVENYISNGGNASQAYIAAGFSRKGADANSSRMLQHETIKNAIKQERERLQILLNFKREDHVRILHGMATATIDDFAPVADNYTDKESYKDLGHLRYALESVEPTKEGTKIKLCDRKAALNELADILGYKVQSNQDSFDDLDSGMASAVARVSSSRKRA